MVVVVVEEVSEVALEVVTEEVSAVVVLEVEHHQGHPEVMALLLLGHREAMAHLLLDHLEVTDHLHRDHLAAMDHHPGRPLVTDHHQEAQDLEVESEVDMEVVLEVASEVDKVEVSEVALEAVMEEALEVEHHPGHPEVTDLLRLDHQEVMEHLLLDHLEVMEHHPLEVAVDLAAVDSEVALPPPAMARHPFRLPIMAHLPPEVDLAEDLDSEEGEFLLFFFSQPINVKITA